MKSAFLPRLVNGPFGDPGLYVGLRWQGKALQFDLGKLDRLPAAEVLKLSHIFVSHTHIDHFVGFDRVLRLFLARDATLELFGPPGIIANVTGKLAGYTWNLVDGYRFAITVHEVHRERIVAVRLRATTGFRVDELGVRAFSGALHEAAGFSVHAAHLDHKIPCLGFALTEPTHLNVRTDMLERLGIPAGPWLNMLKEAIRSDRPDDTTVRATWMSEGAPHERAFRLKDLRDQLIVTTPGQRLVYVVDTLFSKANLTKIVELAHNADVFFCESLFLDEDREQALSRYHLTARQAGTLARLAQVKRLEVFHFSPRYDGQAERIYAEAAAAFSGALAADEPV